MHPFFLSELIGLDWTILFIGHFIMFWSLTMRLDWSWFPLNDHVKLSGSKGDTYRAKVSSLEKMFQNS